ncbi:MAG TPA: tripartite tricarboxylate transporter substrate binding protein [Burkholderiales bacterium]|nr:tripartite tricarboxylate transporter substrate binding protein [Burkholderiales bacterium]
MSSRPLHAALAAVALAIASPAAHPQAYPSKPIRFVVAFAPGGPTDIIARLLSQKLPDALGQPVVVDNRGGAGGNIGAAAVAKSPPDGYTVLATTSALAVNATLFPNAGYDADRDFVPVVNAATQPNVIYVNANAPAKTLAELLAQAKTSKLAFASPGSGTTPHLTAEMLFKVHARLDVTPVHFKGAGPQVTAVLTGEPMVGCGAVSGPLAQIRAGKLRPLAVSSSKRLASLPDVPTLTELGFAGMEDYTWVGLFLPAGTPPEIAQKLSEAVNRALQSPDIRARLDQLAFEPVGGTPREFADYFKAEVAKWGKVVRETGAKPD